MDNNAINSVIPYLKSNGYTWLVGIVSIIIFIFLEMPYNSTHNYDLIADYCHNIILLSIIGYFAVAYLHYAKKLLDTSLVTHGLLNVFLAVSTITLLKVLPISYLVKQFMLLASTFSCLLLLKNFHFTIIKS